MNNTDKDTNTTDITLDNCGNMTYITRHRDTNTTDKDTNIIDIKCGKDANFTDKFTKTTDITLDKDGNTTDITDNKDRNTTDMTLDKDRISLPKALSYLNEQNSEERFSKYRNLFP